MILVISGGAGDVAHNYKLAKMGEAYLKKKEKETALIDPTAYDLPLFMAHTQNLTPSGRLCELRSLFDRAKGFFMVTPEYNGNIPPVLSNLLNSVFNFRYFPENTLEPLLNKPALVASASSSIYGGLKANQTLTGMLHHMGAIICPHSLAVSSAHEHLTSDETFQEDALQTRFEAGLNSLISLSSR